MPALRPRLLRLLAALLLCAGASGASAQERENCFLTAGEQYALDPFLLVAIARVESRMRPLAVRRNGDGTEDIGLMQVNSLWLPLLARHGIRREHLLDHCTSIRVAAWIIASQFHRYGHSWKSFGRYHSKTPSKNAAWVARVVAKLRAEHPNFALLDAGLAGALTSAPAPGLRPRSA